MESNLIIMLGVIIGLLLLILLKIPKANRKYDYLQLSSQESRATFANNEWLGSIKMDGKIADATLFESCPEIKSYVSKLCAEGWELVTVIERVVDHDKNLFFQLYFFKRAK